MNYPCFIFLCFLFRYLIQNGADTNVENINGISVLMTASLNPKRLEIIQYLIENGAEINAKDIKGKEMLKKHNYLAAVKI